MDFITGLWALLSLAVCLVGYLVYRDETQARYASRYEPLNAPVRVSNLAQRHAARKRQIQYELTFWKLFAAFAAIAGVAFVLACLIAL